MKRGSVIDKLVKGYCFILAATPAFWIGLIFLIVFAVYLGWFPVGFSVPICAWMRDESRRESIESVLFGSSSSLFFSAGQTHRYWNSFLNGNDDMAKSHDLLVMLG